MVVCYKPVGWLTFFVQETPISNFVMGGDWTSQKFLGSMEGAVLGGKLAAEVGSDQYVHVCK
jgi:15-cis-phytoene desaturase